MKKIAVLACLLSLLLAYGCAFNLRPIDVENVRANVIKGRTTASDVEKLYGAPYNKGISRDGTTYYYYLSATPFGGGQEFTFYFDKKGKVASYASEYPGGNPLLK